MADAFRYDGRMVRLHFLLGVSLASLALASAAACSSSDDAGDTSTSSSSSSSSSGGTADGGGAKDSGTPPGTDAGADGGVDTSVNACKTFKDETAAGSARTITWAFSVSSSPERCMRVKKGQAVTWNGDFASHPLGPKGGDSPNPISAGAVGTAAAVTFPTAGVFGYECTIHPGMTGAIEVVE
jgi:plastocyanin